MAGLGEALLYLGQAAPGIGKSFDDAEKDKLEREKTLAALKALAQETKANEYKQARTEKSDLEADSRKEAARSAFGRYTLANKSTDLYNQIQIPSDVQSKDSGEMSEVPQSQYANIPDYRKLGSLSKLKRAEEFDLPYHAAADEGVKNTVEQLNKEEALSVKKENPSGGLGGWQARAKDWDAIESMPEGEQKDAAYMNYMNKWAPSSAFGASEVGIDAAGKKAGAAGYGSASGRISAEQDAGGGVNPVIAERSSGLRTEFTNLPEIKSIKTLYQNASKANKAFEQYKAGKTSEYEVDQSLAYFASKALDPNSVVMPGEFDRFAKGLGIAGGAQAMVSQMLSGGLKLNDKQRQAMLNIVNTSIESGKEAAKSQYEYYSDLAKKNGVDPHGVTGSMDYVFSNANAGSGGSSADGWQTINGVKIRKKQ